MQSVHVGEHTCQETNKQRAITLPADCTVLIDMFFVYSQRGDTQPMVCNLLFFSLSRCLKLFVCVTFMSEERRLLSQLVVSRLSRLAPLFAKYNVDPPLSLARAMGVSGLHANLKLRHA